MSQQEKNIMEAIGNAEKVVAGVSARTQQIIDGTNKAIAAAGSITDSPEFKQQLDQVRTAGEKIQGIGTQTRQVLDNLNAGLANPPKIEISPEIKDHLATVRGKVASVTV